MRHAAVRPLLLLVALTLCGWDSGLAQGRSDLIKMVNAGYDLLEKGQVDRAQKVYEDVLKKYPDNPIALNNLGAIMAHKGKYDEAVAYLERARAHAPGCRVTLDRVCDQAGICAAFRMCEDQTTGEDLEWLVKRNILTVKMAQAGQNQDRKPK